MIALEDAREYARAILETVRESVVVLDHEMKVISANRSFCRLFGIAPEKAEGRLLYDLGDRQWDIPELRTLLEDTLSRNVSFDKFAVEKEFDNIGARTMVLNGRAASTGPRGAEMILLAIDDTTEAVKAKAEHDKLAAQLQAAQRMEAVARLAGGVAHDFNNILTVIQTYAGFLLEQLPEADPAHDDAGEISVAAGRAASLTRQLLAFSRRQPQQLAIVNLNEVTNEIDRMLRRLIGEDIDLFTVLAEDIGMVKADVSQIEQILMNLAINARDAMPTGGKLTIETTSAVLDQAYGATKGVSVPPGSYVMLAVTDTGTGIDRDTQQHIFEPFFTTKPRGKGTGLGLSTVFGIVKQNGGHIWVYSEPGKGTTFKIYLPCVEAEATQRPPRIAGAPLGGTETVLVAEDEDPVRKVTTRILERAGYKVLGARHGDDALVIAKRYKDPIHLLVTDVVMPNMSGKTLASRLSELQPDIRVLYMSGYTDNAIVHHGVLDDEVVFVQKPFSADHLLRHVREVLDREIVAIRSDS